MHCSFFNLLDALFHIPTLSSPSLCAKLTMGGIYGISKRTYYLTNDYFISEIGCNFYPSRSDTICIHFLILCFSL